jgi:Mrp family chromosome partitioning ATPase/capsular polysaccharide biosynthesis protein
VSVTGDPNSDVIDFTAKADDATLAVATANAVAKRYLVFRSTVSGISTQQAIAKLRARLAKGTTGKTEINRLLQQLELQQTLNSGDAIVIDPAQKATKVAPTPVRDGLLGAAIGIVLALMISAVRELLSTRVRSEGEIEDIIGRPVIATIPRLPKAAPIVVLGRHEARFGDIYSLLAANIEQEELDDVGRGSHGKAIAIASAVAGEGKTTTAVNLGIAMAKRGLNVALVDFDLRKSALGRIFGLPAQSAGVLQIVQSKRPVDSVLWSYPITGNSSHAKRLLDDGSPRGRKPLQAPLVVVPSGGSDLTGGPARSPNATAMIERLRLGFDVVIIDTPPALLATEMAELSAAVDSVIVVVRYGGPTRRDLTQLSRQAATWKAGVSGVVLTAAPTSFERRQYYYGD